MELKKNLTLLVCTCDSYEDLWLPFFKLLKTYWPTLSCQIVLNTETKKFNYEGLDIVCYQFGKAPYGQRMLNNLSKIATPYTLLLLDDFFIRRPVDVNAIEKIISYMNENSNVAAFQFNENEFCEEKKVFSHFSKIKKYAPYKLNMQAGVWRTNTLMKYWEPKDNPWIWEIFVNFTSFDNSDVFYSLDRYENSPVYYGFNIDGMGVFRGKWVLPDVKPLFDKHNIIIDYSRRGIYDASNAVSRLPILTTMPYVFKRIPPRYALGFSFYEIWKRFLKLVGKKSKYLNYQVYLASTMNMR